MTEELLTVRPPNVIKQTITLSMGPCLVAGAIDIALKALYGENKNHVTKHELNPLDSTKTSTRAPEITWRN